MSMTNNQRRIAYAEAINYTDVDAYVSDLALSSAWEDDLASDIQQSRIDALTLIWRAFHGALSISDIACAAGMSNRKLASRFSIPVRTVENWSAGDRTPPAYVLLLICECLGLI